TKQEKIAFVTASSIERGATIRLVEMNADGSGRVVLAEGPAAELMDPTLSPDGKRIAFAVLNTADKKADIFVMNRDGSGRKRETEQEANTYAMAPAWSPDGKRIAYDVRKGTLLKDKEGSRVYTTAEEIAVMDADGKNATKLGRGSKPAWSP